MFAVSSVSTVLIWILIMLFMYLFSSDSFNFLIPKYIFVIHSVSGSGFRCCKNLLYPESLNPLTWKLQLKMIAPQDDLKSQSVRFWHPQYEWIPNHLINYQHLKLQILIFFKLGIFQLLSKVLSNILISQQFSNILNTYWWLLPNLWLFYHIILIPKTKSKKHQPQYLKNLTANQ